MENLQVNGFNGNPKTLEEFAVNEILDLRRKNERLEDTNTQLYEISLKQKEEVLEWKSKYNELIKKLKEDFDIKIRRLDKNTTYVSVDCLYSNIYADKEKYNYYKEFFNLKEEGENEDEQ